MSKRKSSDPKYDWNKDPDKTLYERFEDNLQLVKFVINRFFPAWVGNEDFYQEACMALWHAINKYDPTVNVRFSTFATLVISNLMRNYIDSYHVHNKPTEELPEEVFDFRQSLDLDDVDFIADLPKERKGEIAIVAQDILQGKTSAQTCAEQGWKPRHYKTRKDQLRAELKRRYYKA